MLVECVPSDSLPLALVASEGLDGGMNGAVLLELTGGGEAPSALRVRAREGSHDGTPLASWFSNLTRNAKRPLHRLADSPYSRGVCSGADVPKSTSLVFAPPPVENPPRNGIGKLKINPIDSSFQVLVIGN